MVEETLKVLAVKPGGFYVDATLGAGGHARAILERGGRVLGLDRDAESLGRARERLAEFAATLDVVHSDYRELPALLAGREAPDGIVADLGLSADHYLEAERGFSFRLEGPLDMRLDRARQTTTAADLLGTLEEEELARIMWAYGGEPAARRIARAVVRRRRSQPLRTTIDFALLIEEVKGGSSHKPARVHAATRAFQALRIAVNDELSGLESFVKDAVLCLKPGGRFVALSFHSLEDRAVKRALRALTGRCTCPPAFPICVCGEKPKATVLTKRPITPGASESAANPRARSAKLRAAERLVP